MENEIEPVAGQWYQRVDDGTLFQVIAIDEDEELVEFQDFDGDLGEVSFEEWRNWDIETSDPPEDWTGPVDDVELEDLEYSDIGPEGERRRLAETLRPEELEERGVSVDEVPDGYSPEILIEGREGRMAGRGSAREREPEEPAPRIVAPPRRRRRADGLSAEQVEAVKARLTERARALRQDIQRELRKYENESYTQLAERVADPGDQAWADVIADMNLAEVTRDVDELREIERALKRLAEGNYGICIECGERIDSQRLEVNPAAVRCVECQRRFEARSRQSRPSL